MKYIAHTDVIWGIGNTPEEARQDAIRWVEELGAKEEDLKFKECTLRLYKKVEGLGGHIPWVLINPWNIGNEIVDIDENVDYDEWL